MRRFLFVYDAAFAENEQRLIQELLGHRDVKTAFVYIYVLNRGGLSVKSPIDMM